MNFQFSEDQQSIQSLAEQIFAKQASDENLLKFSKEQKDYDEALWNVLAEQGLLAICIPENYGGTGLGFSELCLILEEQGKRVAPVPLFSSLVLAALPLIEFASDEQKKRYLPPLSEGKIKLSAALTELAVEGAAVKPVTVQSVSAGWQLNGQVLAVHDGAIADYILVPAVDEDNALSVFIVDTKLNGITQEQQENSFGKLNASFSFNNVQLATEDLLGSAGAGEEMLNWIEQRADTAICAMQVGVCEAALQRTAAFTSERKQFGIPLGSFQAVAMRAADAYIDVEAMRSMYWQAIWRLDNNLRADAEVRAAKWWACDGGHRVVHATQHLHGGIGSDVEFPIHRFFLWAKQLSFMLRNARGQLVELGQLLAEDDSVGFAALEVS